MDLGIEEPSDLNIFTCSRPLVERITGSPLKLLLEFQAAGQLPSLGIRVSPFSVNEPT